MDLPKTLKATPKILPITGAKYLEINPATALNSSNRGANFSWLSFIVEVTLENAAFRPFNIGVK
jgi:hypothetical protein